MFVDSEILRCGAEFSRSAGAVAQQGSDRLAAAQLSPKIFGDFAKAEEFHNAVCHAHETHVTAMRK
ncbi:DUF2563 family protein, partial [Streptomyces doebereineriae]